MSACKYVARTEPRVIPGRHAEGCGHQFDTDSLGCAGCLPCPEPHCRICNRAHAEGTCAECMAETREALRDIGRMCDALPEEVEHRGVEGEALMLLGPVADPEAWGHVEASIQAGRLDHDWVEAGGGEQHPLTVTLGWQMVWRDALDHDEAPNAELATALDYLDRTMGYMSGYEHVPFEDFARDLRRCRSHLEAVLHDGEQVDRGAPCMTCSVPLERVWGANGAEDGWKCPRCRQTSTEDQYRFAVAHLHREEATHLTDRDMEIRTGVKAGTVRVWANRGDVERKRDAGRTLYAVADVERRAGMSEIVAG